MYDRVDSEVVDKSGSSVECGALDLHGPDGIAIGNMMRPRTTAYRAESYYAIRLT